MGAETVLGLLGTTHDPDIRQRCGFPLSLLEEVIAAFKPDVICGEVTPETWHYLTRDSLYQADDWAEPASEYFELILPLCRSGAIEFVPIDWVPLDVWFDFNPFHAEPLPTRALRQQELEARDEALCEVGSQEVLPFNGPGYDQLARAKYDWLHALNPASQLVQWQARNHIMAQRVRNTVLKHAGRRILIVVGADHNYMLADLLRDGDWHFQYPLSRPDSI
jgi:hypothetical protein